MKSFLKFTWYIIVSFFRVIGVHIGLSKLSHSVSSSPSPFPLRFRELLDASSPINPLRRSRNLPSIELAIPSTVKDLPYLESVIKSAISNSENQIISIKVIVPRLELGVFQTILGTSSLGIKIKILDEEKLLGNLLSVCDSISPPDRKGWLIQQVIKYLCVLRSNSNGVLILDSDTLLTERRTWLNDSGTQILMISHEYHLPYQSHYLTFRKNMQKENVSARSPRVSYVTHHQLMQPHILKEMFGGELEWMRGLETWVKSINFTTQSPACEYHCYGTFLELQNKGAFTIARWGNISMNRSDYEEFLQDGLEGSNKAIRSACSISVHAYL